VFFKSVLGKLLGVLFHDVIAADLGDDAGGGDGERVGIALDDALVGQWKIFDWQAINEAMIDGDAVFFLQREGGSGHGIMGGAEDVFGIDLGGIGKNMSPADLRIG